MMLRDFHLQAHREQQTLTPPSPLGLTAPQVVMLELCNGRSGLLHSQAKAEVPSLSRMMEDYRSGKTPLMGVVYAWLLARIGENMEVGRPARVWAVGGHPIPP